MQQLELPLFPRGTVGGALAAYLASETEGLADATMRDYRDRAQWLCAVFGADRALASVGYAHLHDVVAHHGPRSPCGLLCVTLKKRLVLLRAAWRFARAMGWTPSDPPALPRLQSDGERRREILTCAQWPLFRDQLLAGPTRRLAELCWWCGLHTSDAFTARLSWFDVAHVWPWGGRGRWLRYNSKNKRCEPAWFPMEPGLFEAAEGWHRELGPSLEALVAGRVWSVGRSFAAAAERAEVPRVAPIDLRRSFASRLLGAGYDDEYVRQAMGHVAPVGRDGHSRCRPTVLHQHYAVITPELLARAGCKK